ncbi:hypothetical protein AQ1_00282 [alpha proteobacterium Q-1]|nr:hypothetical protein AQ1_00282 [alpha proteobacterium Q-1]
MTEKPQSETEDAPSPDILRMVEALIFAAEHPLNVQQLQDRLPAGTVMDAVEQALAVLQASYRGHGISLEQVGGGYQFRTASDLAFLLRQDVSEPRKLSRAAVETLAIIAYHQPVTRADIEDIRGVGLSRGTLDVLLEAGWVRPRGRRRSPGRPLMFGTSDAFLTHFGLGSIDDLPGLAELKAAGLLDSVDDALARLEASAREDAAMAPDDEGDGQTDLEEVIARHAAKNGDPDLAEDEE